MPAARSTTTEDSYAHRVNKAQAMSLSPSKKSSRNLAAASSPRHHNTGDAPPVPTLTFRDIPQTPMASTSGYVYPATTGDSPSPNSRRFEAVVKRFGLQPPDVTPKGRSRSRSKSPKRDLPYITPPSGCQSTVPGLAEPFESPSTPHGNTATAPPPPRPPRAPGRSPSSSSSSRLSQIMAPSLSSTSASSAEAYMTPTLESGPILEPAFITPPIKAVDKADAEAEDEQWRRDRRLSSLFSGLGLGLSTTNIDDEASEETGGTTSEDLYEDAEEGDYSDSAEFHAFAYEPRPDLDGEGDENGQTDDNDDDDDEGDRVPPLASQLLRQSWNIGREADEFVFRGSLDLVSTSVRRPPLDASARGQTRMAGPLEVAESGDEEDDGQSCSATADVLDDYTASPETPAAVRPLSRRASTPAELSAATVRSWLPTLQPVLAPPLPAPLASPTPSFGTAGTTSSRISAIGFDPISRGSSGSGGSRTSWHSSELADDEGGPPPTPATPASPVEPLMRRKMSQLFSAVQMAPRSRTVSSNAVKPAASTTARPRRRRAMTESAILAAPVLAPPPPSARGETRSASTTPLIGSSPILQATWRSALAEGEYDELLEAHGQMEMRRQEVVAELCSTEAAFVAGLRGVVRVFFQPLRQPNGAWIRGVPASVGRLFDWLEDIVWLHGEMVDALDRRRTEQAPLVIRIADALLDFIPKLEVHQPYLVRFEAVTAAIERMAGDPASDFGEFVRMQQALPECGSMTLSSFLLKPVQRLMKYPLFFKQLCDLTPPAHPDHLASLSLLHSTDTLIRVMQEVKMREEEYSSVKALSAQIRNLPVHLTLARRDRRLIAHGVLRRVHLSAKGAPKSPPSPSASPSTDALSLTARLMPITSPSMSSRRSSVLAEPSPTIPSTPKFRLKPKETPLHVFVFSDIVLCATYHPEGGRSKKSPSSLSASKGSRTGTYKLIDQLGVGRVLGVIDLTGQTNHEHLIELSVLPIAGDESLAHLARACSAPVSLYLTLAPAPPSASAASRVKDRQRWVAAFEQSLRTTLRALASPAAMMPPADPPAPSTSARRLSSSVSTSAASHMAERWSVTSTLAAGLPMPKSPSLQASNGARMSQLDAETQGEREERGWWAGRLKAVRREVAFAAPETIVPVPIGTTRRMKRRPTESDEVMLRRAVEGVVLASASSRGTAGYEL